MEFWWENELVVNYEQLADSSVAIESPGPFLGEKVPFDGQVGLLNKTHTVTIQTQDNLANDTIDVNVVTS